MYKISILILLCAAAYIVGCSAPAPVGIEPLPQTQLLEEPQFEPVDARPILWDRTTAPWGKELIARPSLADITAASTAATWKIYAAYNAVYTIDRAAAPPNVDAMVGYEGILNVKGKGPFSLSQKIANIPPDPAERWLQASIWAQCEVPGGLTFTLNHSANSDTTIHTTHDGSGWAKLTIEGPYTWGAQPGAITFSVNRREQDAPIALARPSLRIIDEHPTIREQAIGAPGELLVNGSFDRYADAGLPYPWRFNFWRGDPGEVQVAWRDPRDPNAGRLIKMTQPKGSMRVFQNLPRFEATDAGKSYTARLDVLASNPKDLRFNLRASKPGAGDISELENFIEHPGDGAWHTLEIPFTLPTDTQLYPLAVSFEIIRRNIDPKPVLLDNASFRLNP